jgi:hypothetical protein
MPLKVTSIGPGPSRPRHQHEPRTGSSISVTSTIGEADGERAFRARRFTLAGGDRRPAPPSTGAGAAAVGVLRSRP